MKIECDSLIDQYLARSGEKVLDYHFLFTNQKIEKPIGDIVKTKSPLKPVYINLATALELTRKNSFPSKVVMLLCAGTVIEVDNYKCVPCIIKHGRDHFSVSFRRLDQLATEQVSVGLYFPRRDMMC